MSQPLLGDVAPDFTLARAGGGEFRLAGQRGRIIVLYFYPSDDTPTCTSEAVAFSAARERFDALGAVVVGVSPDGVSSHERFAAKHGLEVELLADPGRIAIEAYGVWAQKSTFGRTYMGVVRSTFLIGRDGRIAAEWRGIRLKGHVDAVLAATEKLQSR